LGPEHKQTPGDLAAIRERLSALDRQLLELAAERQRLSGEVARSNTSRSRA
jgi:chorismate mutase